MPDRKIARVHADRHDLGFSGEIAVALKTMEADDAIAGY
jgi:hypothetical protein